MADAAESKTLLRGFGPSDPVADPKNVQWQGEGWRVQFKKGNPLLKLFGVLPENVTLFDIDPGDVPRRGMVVRMKVKAEGPGNEFKATCVLANISTSQLYMIQTGGVKSGGEWVVLESTPAASDDMRGTNQLMLSISATKFGTVIVRDVELLSYL